MASKLSDLARTSRATLFRALCDRFKADPVLSGVVKTWRVMDDNPRDLDDASISQCPWARISPADGGTVPETVGLSTSGMLIRIELAIAGTKAEDMCNLWGAFERSIFPGDGTVQLLIQDNGTYALKLRAPAFGSFAEAEVRMQTATAYLACEMLVNTAL